MLVITNFQDSAYARSRGVKLLARRFLSASLAKCRAGKFTLKFSSSIGSGGHLFCSIIFSTKNIFFFSFFNVSHTIFFLSVCSPFRLLHIAYFTTTYPKIYPSDVFARHMLYSYLCLRRPLNFTTRDSISNPPSV